MQEGSLRADVNLSVRPVGQKEFGTRTEMKNINSFKAIARAIAGEYRRQVELIEDGGQVKQQTRRWDDNKDASFAMRSKENAQDYRYFPEPGSAGRLRFHNRLSTRCAPVSQNWQKQRLPAISRNLACRNMTRGS